MKVFVFTLFSSLLLGATALAYGNIDDSGVRCYRNSRVCTTDISWQTNLRDAVVTVVNFNERNPREKLFACGRYGREYIDWIRPNNRYTFKLYSGRCPRNRYPNRYELGRLLDSHNIYVRDSRRGYSDLNARIFHRDRHRLNVVIDWEINSYQSGTGVVTVERIDQGMERESLMACGKQGREQINWVQPNGRYIFRLYEGRDCPRSGRYPRPGELGNLSDSLQIINGRVIDRR